ncbi:MAG: hypothetical protein KJ060_18500 [Candidatus Hydrogenedentes bacterium]|nr:hypothetical protein [Candidatus Hydrogenedentota bacterium]
MSTVVLVMRWAHILAAVTAVGGVLFIRFVLMPSAAAVRDDETHQKLRAAIMKRWQHIVHTCILLFLISGLYNYLAVTRFLHDDQPAYHMIFGIKFLLAIVIFALALGLTSTKGWAKVFRGKSKMWTTLLAVLAIAVVALSGVLRNLPTNSAHVPLQTEEVSAQDE